MTTDFSGAGEAAVGSGWEHPVSLHTLTSLTAATFPSMFTVRVLT
ncbi:hypothetical protein [Arthrobacter sp. HS15c]